MKAGSVTYRISPALFAEYCYFSVFRAARYRLARTLGLVAVAAAGIIAAIWGFAYGKSEITVLGGAIVLCAVMLPYVQNKYIKGRYNTVYGKHPVTYTAEFSHSGVFTLSAGEVTEKYTRSDIKRVTRIRGGFVIDTVGGNTFLVPATDTLPDIQWFAKTYGKAFRICK